VKPAFTWFSKSAIITKKKNTAVLWILQEKLYLVTDVILSDRLSKEMKKVKKKFNRAAVKVLPEETKASFKNIANEIFLELVEMAGAPLAKQEDITEALKKLEKFLDNKKIMEKIVNKLRPKYDEEQVKVIILAFRRAYKSGKFIGPEDEFAT
jgi:hypothetical protein